MLIHLLSDLHLSEDTPRLNRLFIDTLLAWYGKIDTLYILGDLFEYWAGDDDDSAFIQTMCTTIRQFAEHTPLRIMHGNRDFLLGSAFAQTCQVELIDEPYLLTVGSTHYLLCHGDALCTDDLAYQAFRRQSRDPAWQQAMLARPLAERHAFARHARRQSEQSRQQADNSPITDVAEPAVHALLAAHDWPVMIHGHTHRPACHTIRVDGHCTQRWVITDWHDEHGGYLAVDENGVCAHPL